MSKPEPSKDEQDLDGQYRRAFGELGHRIGQEMARDHLPENLWTVAQLRPQPADHILESALDQAMPSKSWRSG